ncbi:MAG TPA: hypothetical protein VHQ95_19670 [Pyrinomonadaceae bacterium]|nr:hypothetical protein [Pyrinomonadaceae bacterium]
MIIDLPEAGRQPMTSEYFNPLRVFLPASLFLFLIVFVNAIIDFIHHNTFGVGAAIVILTAVQILGLGLLADLTVRRTRL